MVGRRAPQEASPDRAVLQRERQQLLERLAAIDRVLTRSRERAVVTPPEKRG